MKIYNKNNRKKQPLGNDAGKVTKIFNISAKLGLRNSYIAYVNDAKVCRTLKEWIDTDPCLIWEKLYTTGEIALCRDAHSLLTEVIKRDFPEKYSALVKKKLQRKALNKYREIQNAS